MSTAKATPSSPAHGDTCSFARSLDGGTTSLKELRNQIAVQSGRLILVSEKEYRNGYSVFYQPAASSASICRKYYGEVLQRWQRRHSGNDRTCSERKLIEAAARRAMLRQAELERLARQMQLIEKVHGKKQELFELKCAQAQQASGRDRTKVLEAWQRRIEQQKELKQKLLKQAKKSARCREELERRAVELRNRIEAREKQAYALRCEHLQRIRRKCVATAERSSMASTVTSEDRRSKGATGEGPSLYLLSPTNPPRRQDTACEGASATHRFCFGSWAHTEPSTAQLSFVPAFNNSVFPAKAGGTARC
ncbi:uncharacterized protein LOC34624403 [Cyclospora cayetanensis]|uniref:Uncharacterized protein LOC34624403 n=1 Tax=Cyclospora cayetanensis TaxID=88456 RepID=A0A6P6RYV7_9EIME|nr:uncharacterized protein LOC34624403 [Cyclospora cayetanensis]